MKGKSIGILFTYVGAPIAGMVYGSANAAGEVNENKALLREAAALGRQVAGGA